jgi:hypothetical protein
VWTDSTSLWTGGAFGPPWTRAIAAHGASLELGLRPLRGSRSPAKGAGRRQWGRGTIWRPHLAPTGDLEAAGRRGVATVVGARWAWPSERGEEGMMMGTSCGGGGRGVAPFYRVGEAGRWPAGCDGGGGVLSRWWPVTEGEAKRRRRRPRDI